MKKKFIKNQIVLAGMKKKIGDRLQQVEKNQLHNLQWFCLVKKLNYTAYNAFVLFVQIHTILLCVLQYYPYIYKVENKKHIEQKGNKRGKSAGAFPKSGKSMIWSTGCCQHLKNKKGQVGRLGKSGLFQATCSYFQTI